MSDKQGGKKKPSKTGDEPVVVEPGPGQGEHAEDPAPSDEIEPKQDPEFAADTAAHSDEEAEVETEAEPEPEADSEPESEPGPVAADIISVKRSGSAVSGLAFVLAIAALGATGYLWMQQQRLMQQSAQPVDTGMDTELAAIANEAKQRDRQLREITRSVDAQRAQIGNQLQQIDRTQGEMRTRLGAYDQALASIQGVSAESRDGWLLSEVEYLMEIAARRVALLADTDTALVAMIEADQRLATLDDPRLTLIRTEMSREIRALQAIRKPDITGISLKLGSLAAASANFILRGNRPAANDAPVNDEEAGVDRAMSLVGDALGSLVRVQRTDESVTPLLAPEEQYFLYRNLELMLLTARIALLKGDAANYRESLRLARSWLETYFDTSAQDVRTAMSDLVEMESSDITPNVPQIGAALRQLRALRTAQRPATGVLAPEPAENDEAVPTTAPVQEESTIETQTDTGEETVR